MARMGAWHGCAWLAITFICCMRTLVDGRLEDAREYQAFMGEVRTLMSHPYRDNTAVMMGGSQVRYQSLYRFGGTGIIVELILFRNNLYVLGYRTRIHHQRVVYLFSDAEAALVNPADYDRLQRLRFGGGYGDLENHGAIRRQELGVSTLSLAACVHLLRQEPNSGTEQAWARCMMALVMVVSEGSRFTEIYDSVYDTLRVGQRPWQATDRHVALMNTWYPLSSFIVDGSQDVQGTTTRHFPSLGETLTVRAALGICSIILRCFDTPRTSADQCGRGPGIDAAIADGVNNVYFFNGPNFAYVRFTPGTTDDRIEGGMKSIFKDWTFLQGTLFVDGLDSAFRIPNSNNAYIFKGDQYALIDVLNQRLMTGPKTIGDYWPSLKPTVLASGIDAAFHSIRPNQVYMFRDDQYAVVYYQQGSTNDSIITGPKSIYSSWPSLRPYPFVNGLDASFALPDRSEAYLFRRKEYVRVDYAPGTTDDKIVAGPYTISGGWPSLADTCFDI